MVNLELCCITLGTTNAWHFYSQSYGITYTCAMKETWFVVNIS